MKIDKHHEVIIRILAKELRKNRKIIIKHVSKETGIKEIWLNNELKDALFALKYLPIQAKKVLEKRKIYVPNYNKEGFIDFYQKGNILQILPSSTPILSCVLLPFCASLSGNNVIVKPSSSTRYLGRFIQQILDNNQYKNIKFKIGKGKNLLYSLIEDADFVFYMGSKKIGKSIELFCCKNDVEFLGEFEGNDWAILLDGNISKIATQISKNVLFKDGRDCDSIKGELIKNSKYYRMKKILFRELKNLIREYPTNRETIFPSFKSSLWIKKINELDDILEIMEKNKHGLSVCIYDTNRNRAINLANKINTSRVVINSDTLDINPLIPWGGVKETSRGGVDYWVNKFINKKLIEIN